MIKEFIPFLRWFVIGIFFLGVFWLYDIKPLMDQRKSLFKMIQQNKKLPSVKMSNLSPAIPSSAVMPTFLEWVTNHATLKKVQINAMQIATKMQQSILIKIDMMGSSINLYEFLTELVSSDFVFSLNKVKLERNHLRLELNLVDRLLTNVEKLEQFYLSDIFCQKSHDFFLKMNKADNTYFRSHTGFIKLQLKTGQAIVVEKNI